MQIRIAIESNTGGSGKTTLATHLAYGLGAKGFSVVVIELDANGSISGFMGVEKLASHQKEQSIAAIFDEGFEGNYPAIPAWANHLKTVKVVRGGAPLRTAIRGLHLHALPNLVLKHQLEDYPIDADVLIFDTPADLEPMGLLALAACTHLLIAIKPEYKDSMSAGEMLNWYYERSKELRLRPQPELLGFVPVRADFEFAVHRNLLGVDKKGKQNPNIPIEETIPGQLNDLGIYCFPPVRESAHFLSASASGVGQPVQIYAPGSTAARAFDPIVNKVVDLLKGSK